MKLLSKKQYAQLLSAYAMLESEYQRYKKGVKEALGEDLDDRVKRIMHEEEEEN